jgi:hypothetical protein
MPVSSNSTGMVHSEQMLTLDGAIRIGKTAIGSKQVENETPYALQCACVVRRPTREESSRSGNRIMLEGRWIGELLPRQSAPLSMSGQDTKKTLFAAERAAELDLARDQPLNLEPMFQLALEPQNLAEGETRLVARIDDVMPGQKISPAASQVRGAILVVAHLEYAPLPPPQPDLNTRQDVKAQAEDESEDEVEFE